MKVANSLDLQQNELRNAAWHVLAGAPSSPVAGQFYFNSTTNGGYVWCGSVRGWRPIDAALLTDGSIPNSALTTNPLARGNHTGTQLAATISDLATTVQGYRLDMFAAPTANISMGGQRITTLSDPSNASDAATKNYVDSVVDSAAAGIDSKPSVRSIATSNITLSGTQTIDGISLGVGDRVLVAGQTTATQNGVYIVAAGAWSRPAAVADAITPGAFWYVEEGTSYGKTQWRCSNTGTITIGTTAITINQFGAATMFSADGSTTQLTGTVFSVKLDASGWLTSSPNGVAVDKTKVPGKFSATLTGDASTTSYTVTHNLGTTDVIVQVRDGSGNLLLVDTQAASSNTAVITYAAPLGVGTSHRVTVLG